MSLEKLFLFGNKFGEYGLIDIPGSDELIIHSENEHQLKCIIIRSKKINLCPIYKSNKMSTGANQEFMWSARPLVPQPENSL